MFDALGPARQLAEDGLAELVARDAATKLYGGDGSLWSDDPALAAEISAWLGWLPMIDEMRVRARVLETWGEDASQSGDRVVLCGMGGSSLAPLVFERVFGGTLHVLDTTDPDAVRAVPVEGSRFVISSKSGSTVEPNVMLEHFWAETGGDGRRFVAVTDHGSKLQALAADREFARAFVNRSDIGGRYSALSYFGLVPAVLAGIHIVGVLDGAAAMLANCAPGREPDRNPGLQLGAILGGCARNGRDKATIVASPRIAAMGLWLEQLLAESTGKDGRGVVPVADEVLGEPAVYGDDRVFFHLRTDDTHDASLAALAAAGHPVVTIEVDLPGGIGAQMLLWEIATAYAGALLRVNPFDQPHVEHAKQLARDALAAFTESGKLPPAPDGLLDVAALLGAARDRKAAGAHPYVAIQAYVTPSEENEASLQALRHRIRDALGVATTFGFGPRYLHSTGQLHKGGDPQEGIFLQVLADTDSDLPIPGASYGFRTLIEAQALGDASALVANGSAVARVRLDEVAGLVDAALHSPA